MNLEDYGLVKAEAAAIVRPSLPKEEPLADMKMEMEDEPLQIQQRGKSHQGEKEEIS